MPWHRIGDIWLGEPKARVDAEYGPFRVIQRYSGHTQGGYRRHGSTILVMYYGDRVGEIGFSSPYYRTKHGFGVGSRIPTGGHWHGFVWNGWNKGTPCNCWVKVGTGAKSLAVSPRNFLKPWTFVNVKHRRVTSFYFARRFVD